MRGKVKFFNEREGWGFILDNYDTSYFVHISQVEGKRCLYQNQEVEFMPTKNDKGLAAINVKVVKNG